MSTLLKLLVTALAALIGKAGEDPNYVPRSRHLVRFTRVPPLKHNVQRQKVQSPRTVT